MMFFQEIETILSKNNVIPSRIGGTNRYVKELLQSTLNQNVDGLLFLPDNGEPVRVNRVGVNDDG